MARKNLIDRKVAARRELEAAKAKFAKLEKETADRIGRLAIKSWLTDLDLTDDQIKAEFDEIVARHTKELRHENNLSSKHVGRSAK
jgi:hypothetical protein